MVAWFSGDATRLIPVLPCSLPLLSSGGGGLVVFPHCYWTAPSEGHPAPPPQSPPLPGRKAKGEQADAALLIVLKVSRGFHTNRVNRWVRRVPGTLTLNTSSTCPFWACSTWQRADTKGRWSQRTENSLYRKLANEHTERRSPKPNCVSGMER